MPTKPTKTRPNADAVTEVKVSPALRRAYEELLSTMAEAKREEAEGFDRYWESVAAILDKRLWMVGGFPDADVWIAKAIDEPRRTVFRNVRVAKYASAAEETKWGTTKLDAAIGFIEAMLGAPVEGKLPVKLGALRIPVKREGRDVELGLDDVAWPEVAAATRKLLRQKGKGRAVPEPVEEAFVRAIDAERVLDGIKVRVADGRLHLTGIPIAHLKVLLRVLRTVDWRAAAAPPAPTKKRASKTKPKRSERTTRPRT